jgi:hypothetical protein
MLYSIVCGAHDVNPERTNHGQERPGENEEKGPNASETVGQPRPRDYFSLNKDKKTKLIYLGKKRDTRAKEYSANYKKLLEIAEEMTILNMGLLKADACL